MRGLAAVTTAALVPKVGNALEADQRVATPAQTEGPFYPIEWGGDIDSDLVSSQ